MHRLLLGPVAALLLAACSLVPNVGQGQAEPALPTAATLPSPSRPATVAIASPKPTTPATLAAAVAAASPLATASPLAATATPLPAATATSPPVAPTPWPTAEPGVLRVYFPSMDQHGAVSIVAVRRQVADDQRTASTAAASWVAGPSGAERAADVQLGVHRNTEIRSVQVQDGTATVDFGPRFREVYGRPWVEAVYWSLALTLLDVPGVQHVSLTVDGQPLGAFGDPPFTPPADPQPASVPFPVSAFKGGQG